MLKPKVIAQVLKQATRDGVKATMLMTSEGSLLAFAADNDQAAKLYGAISANVWSTYKLQLSTSSFLRGDQAPGLRFLLLDCEEGVVFVTGISTMLLCLVGDLSVDIGILKKKAEALAQHLEDPLARVVSYQGSSD